MDAADNKIVCYFDCLCVESSNFILYQQTINNYDTSNYHFAKIVFT